MQPGPPDPSLGVFETLLACDRRVQALDAHLERLAGSVAELYGFELPGDVRDRVLDLAASDAGAKRLRIDAVPAADDLRIELMRASLPVDHNRGVICRLVIVPGGLGRHKWVDRRLIDRLGAGGRVPLLVDSNGDLLEAAWANVWVLEDGRLVTPPADGRILPGVTRAMLLGLRPEASEEPITVARARTARTLFLTSALRHAVVATLDEQPVEDAELANIRAALGTSAWSCSSAVR
jgi:para-aminobenzoate synthetase/4-amino-4-deoxychorismate lyase